MSDRERRSATRSVLMRRAARVFPNMTVDHWPDHERSSIAEVRTADCQIVRLRVPGSAVDLSGKRAVDDGMGQHVKLVWQLRGRSRPLGKSVDTSMAEGETAVLLLSQSYRLEAGADYDALLLVFNAARRPEWRALAHQWPPLAGKIDSAGFAARAGVASLMRHADQGRGDALAIEACLDLMAQVLAGEERRRPPSWADHHYLRKAASLVEQRIGDREFGPDQLARVLGRSRRSLYEDFGELGTTPAEFIRNVRLQKARQEILAEGDKGVTLTDIALRCGFADSASFSHVFKKAYGVPPSALQRPSR